MGIVVKPAELAQRLVQRVLSGMAKRRMADVVGQAQCLGQVFVQPQGAGNDPADLGHFKTVGQADAVMVAVRRDEHLGLVAQAAEGDRMNHPVAVALEGAARPAGQQLLDRELPPAALRRITGERRPHTSRLWLPIGPLLRKLSLPGIERVLRGAISEAHPKV